MEKADKIMLLNPICWYQNSVRQRVTAYSVDVLLFFYSLGEWADFDTIIHLTQNFLIDII